ncbi:glycosyltransferase family 4 protein, partial [Citrobacter braakii]|nr:glycosyltransferase family 4 protein [Citrobacter braakii]
VSWQHHPPGVVMTGFLRGDELQAVFSQAQLFVMPSYHEGLPIALLEAMSFSLPAVVSDIPANLEVQLPSEAYFKVGDVTSLAEKLTEWAATNSVDYRVYLQNYNWHEIAKKTINVYHSIDKDIG